MADDCEYLGRQMAELHFILMTKRDNHGLDIGETAWFEVTEKYYSEFGSTLDKDKITFELAKARVIGKVMDSTVTGKEINTNDLQRVKWNLYVLDKKREK